MSCSASACEHVISRISSARQDSGCLRSARLGWMSSAKARGGGRPGPGGAGWCRSCRRRSLGGAGGHGGGSAGFLCRGLASPQPAKLLEVTGRGRGLSPRKLLHHSGGGRMVTYGLQVSCSSNEEADVSTVSIELLRSPFRAKFQATH